MTVSKRSLGQQEEHMALNPLGINNGTESFINFDQQGTVNTQVVNIGTISGNLPGGTITLSNPTGTTVQFNNGTVDLLKAGTITTLPNIPGGTLGVVTSVTEVANLAKGTITRLEGGTLGVVSSVTDIANVTKGTITRVEGGTITLSNPTGTTVQFNNGTVDLLKAGTITRLEGGTLGVVSSVADVANLAKGTITRLEGGTLGVVSSVTDVANLAKGTITRLEGGTLGVVSSVTDVANLAKGTITRVEGGTVNLVTTVSNLSAGSVAVTAGTITAGTINTGTIRINPNPTIVTNSYGTTSSGTIGTIIAAPSAGSAIFITSLSVSVQSGTAEPCVSFGLAANGNQVISRGRYAELGGIVHTFPTPNSGSATGTALTWNVLSGSGTVSYNVSYFVAVP